MRSDSPEHVVIAETEHPAPPIRQRGSLRDELEAKLHEGRFSVVGGCATRACSRRTGRERPPRAPLHEQRKKATLNAAHERRHTAGSAGVSRPTADDRPTDWGSGERVAKRFAEVGGGWAGSACRTLDGGAGRDDVGEKLANPHEDTSARCRS